jgi:small multidrug resistance pump
VGDRSVMSWTGTPASGNLFGMGYLYLAVAIVAEVIATSSLKASNGFTRLGPSLAVATGYAVAFFFLSLTLKTVPVGVAYALWSGAGTILIALVARLFYRQALDFPAIMGIGLIVLGVATINVCSKSAPR